MSPTHPSWGIASWLTASAEGAVRWFDSGVGTGRVDDWAEARQSGRQASDAPASGAPVAATAEGVLGPAIAAQAMIPVAQSYVPAATPLHYPPFQGGPEVSSVSPSVTVINTGMPPGQSVNGPALQMMSGGGYLPVQELTPGGLVLIGGEYYRVEQVVGPKPDPKAPNRGEPQKAPPRISPNFSVTAPKEATSLFKDVWDGRQAGRQARGLLAGCHEAMLVVLAHLETRAADLRRRGKLASRRESFFRPASGGKSASPKERIDKLVEQGLLLRTVGAAADHVKLEIPSEPEARSQVSDGDVDSYISLLWLMLEQGFDQAQWSEDGKPPPHRLPPPAPQPGQPPKTELPPGAAVLLPVSRTPAKPA